MNLLSRQLSNTSAHGWIDASKIAESFPTTSGPQGRSVNSTKANGGAAITAGAGPMAL